MRGESKKQVSMLTIAGPGQRVPKDHPIRAIKALSDAALKGMNARFDAMYAESGRPSIPPEALLKAQLLIALYSIRSERQFCERLNYDLLFRYFLDMDMEEEAFDASTFAKNKARLLEGDVAREFFYEIVNEARRQNLVSLEHFTVDGTLIEAWASLKSFKRRDAGPKDPPDDPGNPTVDFHGEKRSNETHASTTDPEAKLARKGSGKEAKMSYSGNVLMENRNGLCVEVAVAPASGTAERVEALSMIGSAMERGFRPKTVAGDKGYDDRQFVEQLREEGITAHVAQKQRSQIDGRTTRHPGYSISQRIRKRIEEIFGWMKSIGGLRKTRYRGTTRVGLHAVLTAAAYNLVRMAKLVGTATA